MANVAAAKVTSITDSANAELKRFWAAHPDLRSECKSKYGHDPVDDAMAYWKWGLGEPEHRDVRERVEANGGVFGLADVKEWERQEVEHAKLEKSAVPAWAHYRKATVDGERCGTCDYYSPERSACEMFDMAPVSRGMVCDRWAGRIDKDGDLTNGSPHALTDEDLGRFSELLSALEPNPIVKADVPKAAGIAVRARDTGRLLMIQRSFRNKSDPARGTWEFPGGKIEDGEDPEAAAKREWAEEIGMPLPRGKRVGSWRSGVYQGIVHEVATESSVPVNADHEDRKVLNPDDPDGDDIEVSAWWHPDHLQRMSALRPELKSSRSWRDKVAKSAQPGTLYLIRHGKTRMNNRDPAKDRIRGWKDVPLDSTGVKQARQLAKVMQGKNISIVYSSDLRRTLATARPIAAALKVPLRVDHAFRPWGLGDFEGQPSEIAYPKLKIYAVEKPDAKVPGGESFNEFTGRLLKELNDLLAQVKAGKTIAVVTHYRDVKVADAWIAGNAKKLVMSHFLDDDLEPGDILAITWKNGRWRWLEDDEVSKAQAHPAELNLRVAGVHRSPNGLRVYRMESRDGRHVGMTNQTPRRFRKGDVVKVQAQDFLQDTQGDLRWMNANVVSGYKDAPQSWRDLCAIAGGALAKDGAPGPAGNIPPAGDMGASSSLPSGPTLDAVHVNVPLDNISINYATKGRPRREDERVLRGEFLPIAKEQAYKQLVYGVVLEPNSVDSQDDFMLPHHVEKTAHNYLKKAIRGKSSVAKLQHRVQGFKRDRPSIVPVESFIAPVDFSYDGKDMIKKGTWVMVMHVEDPDLWRDFLNGKYTGFSVGGSGMRQSITGPTDLVPHGLIGATPANFFQPNPRDMGLVRGG